MATIHIISFHKIKKNIVVALSFGTSLIRHAITWSFTRTLIRSTFPLKFSAFDSTFQTHMLSYCISAGNVFTTLLFSSHPPPPFLPGQRNAGARGQSGEDSWMCLSMVCEAASDVASHATNVFRSICWFFGLDFPKPIITLGITLLKELQKFEEKSTPAKSYTSGHALVICSSSVAVLCWCGQLTWPWLGFEWPTFLKWAGRESSFTLAFWSFSRECIYQ